MSTLPLERPTLKIWREDLEAIAITMSDNLSDLGGSWFNVSADQLQLDDCSGFGGGKTFKVYRRDTGDDEPVVLHILPVTMAPAGCHIWWFATKSHHFFENVSESELNEVIQTGPRPASRAGSRLVTSHGDIHRGNLIRVDGDLKLIDLESIIVNYAIHDICYAVEMNCESIAHKSEFALAYLEASRQASGPDDVFNLLLDIERCKLATNFFDLHSVWQLESDKAVISDLKGHRAYVEISDRALMDEVLARTMVDVGFDQVKPVRQLDNQFGKCRTGSVITVHHDEPDNPNRNGFVVNEDGTIQLIEPMWRGLVIGLDNNHEIVLCHWSDTGNLLSLDMEELGSPVTGIPEPVTQPKKLLLSGENRALVLSPSETRHFEGSVNYVNVGSREQALSVYFEPDGRIRMAHEPRQSFDCAGGRVDVGTQVLIFTNHDGDNQRFQRNEDLTISPRTNPDAVLGIVGKEMILVGRDDLRRLNFLPHIRSAGEIVARLNVPGNNRAQLLLLKSHPGMALSVDPAQAKNGYQVLAIVPQENAKRFIIADDHVRLADNNQKLTLGLPARNELIISS
jgi:hypothetical protein